MHLNKLFLEDGNPRPNAKAILQVLEQGPWYVRHINFPTNFPWTGTVPEGISEWAKSLKQIGVMRVHESKVVMALDISRYNQTAPLMEPLRREYYPHIDVPRDNDDKASEFHTDDVFEEPDWELLGFEFYIALGHDIGAVASLADTDEEIVLPPEVMEWMSKKFQATIIQINSELNQL